MGHKKGMRKREGELGERVVVDRALDVEHKKYCPICGKRVTELCVDDPEDRVIVEALESGKCPDCGSGLKVTDDGILFCSRRPVCEWCIYVSDLRRR